MRITIESKQAGELANVFLNKIGFYQVCHSSSQNKAISREYVELVLTLILVIHHCLGYLCVYDVKCNSYFMM